MMAMHVTIPEMDYEMEYGYNYYNEWNIKYLDNNYLQHHKGFQED